MDTSKDSPQDNSCVDELYNKYLSPKNEASSKTNSKEPNTTTLDATSSPEQSVVKRKPKKRTHSKLDSSREYSSTSDEESPLQKKIKSKKLKCRQPKKSNKRDPHVVATPHKSSTNLVSSTPIINGIREQHNETLPNISPIRKSAGLSTIVENDDLEDLHNTENIEKPTLMPNSTQHSTADTNSVADESVQIIESPVRTRRRNRIASVIVVNDEDDSDVQIIDGPSTSSGSRKRTTRNSKNKRNNKNQKSTGGRRLKKPITEIAHILSDSEDEADTQEETPRGIRSCPVCLRSMVNKEISSTICGHVFCTACIQKVLRTTKQCPNCRTKLGKNKIHPLFI